MSRIVFTKKLGKLGLAAILSFSLVACEEGATPNLFKKNGDGGGFFKKDGNGGGFFKKTPKTKADKAASGSIKLVERDVESPEVFQVTEKSLWDGRPSLGGVWVAHPDSKQPERVIIRNETNGKFVIGALFKRERNNPGPRLQLSSDAAAALGVQAGSPTTLNVTALRRETVNVGAQTGEAATPDTVTTQTIAPAPKATVTTTDDIKSSVLKSVKAAEDKKATSGTTTTTAIKPKAKAAVAPVKAAPKPAAKSAPKSSLSSPFIQLGFFSVEKNAKDTLKSLEVRKIPGRIVKASAKGKTFWRVVAGPAQTKGEQAAYMSEIKKMGFSDAYLSKN